MNSSCYGLSFSYGAPFFYRESHCCRGRGHLPLRRRTPGVLRTVCCGITCFVLFFDGGRLRADHAETDSSVQAPADSLDEEIAAIRARPEFAASTFGIVVAKLGSGRILYEHNPDKLFAPASTAKLVSSAGALAALGKHHRFVTRVVARQAPESGVLQGDLTLVAAGDPNLSARVLPAASGSPFERLAFVDRDHSYCGLGDGSVVEGDPLAVLENLAEQIRAAAVERIDGDVVVDDGLFTETKDSFVGTFSAACVNDNLIDVFVAPGAELDAPPRVRWQPQSRTVKITVRATTGLAGEPNLLWLEPRDGPGDGPANFELRGTIALDSKTVLRTVPVRQPALLAAVYLKELLEKQGVQVDGSARARRHGPAHYEGFPTLAIHTSAPLSETLRVVLKTSQNLHATMLPVLVGALRGQRGDRYAGFRVIARHLRKMGLDTSRAVFASGSGGGREDHVSASWLVDLLRALAHREDFPVLLDALPIGGVDGTLARHFGAPDLVGRVRAKTGTLLYQSALDSTWVYVSKALAGYLAPSTGIDTRTDGALGRLDWTGYTGDKLVFAILIHGTRANKRSEGTAALFAAQEDIVRAVLRHLQGE